MERILDGERQRGSAARAVIALWFKFIGQNTN
jgi:hypothetical protein